jgi:hypothetical protein
MDALRSLIIVAGCGLAAASWGCASARRASSEPEVPPLVVPAPPPRTLPPLEGGPIEAAVPTTAVGTETPERPQQRRRPDSRPTEARTDRSEASRTESTADAPRPVPDTQPAEPPPPAAPALQLAPPGGIPQAEENVQRQLRKADADLNEIDYAALAREAQAQYDTAKRFMLLANQALRDKNLVFAQTLADKAANLAAVLLQR